MLSFRVKYAIQVLGELERSRLEGVRVRLTDLRGRCGFDSQGLSSVMGKLRRAGWVDTVSNRHFIKINLSTVTLCDLVEAVDGAFIMGSCIMNGWPEALSGQYGVARGYDSIISQEIKERLGEIWLTDLLPGAGEETAKPAVKEYARRRAVTGKPLAVSY